DTPFPLPGAMGALAVDSATSRVFVSVPDHDTIEVFNFDGVKIDSVDEQPNQGASGLVVHGAQLYATPDCGSIRDISPTTLRSEVLSASVLPGIDDIVFAAGALWVTKKVSGTVSLVRVDTSDGSAASFTNPLGNAGTGLVADPAHPDV